MSGLYDFVSIEELKGKTLSLVEHNSDEAVFTTDDGARYRMYHSQDCCESVTLDKVEGNLDSILNSPIIEAIERIGHDDPKNEYESVTFSDFALTTEKGTVTFKWIGSSNGYYSESVYFIQIDAPKPTGIQA